MFRIQISDFRFQIFLRIQNSYLASLERLFLALRGTIFTQSEFSAFRILISLRSNDYLQEQIFRIPVVCGRRGRRRDRTKGTVRVRIAGNR